MPKILHEKVDKTTLLVNSRKIRELRHLFSTDNNSEAVRQAIDHALAYTKALKAARRIQKRSTFGRK